MTNNAEKMEKGKQKQNENRKDIGVDNEYKIDRKDKIEKTEQIEQN